MTSPDLFDGKSGVFLDVSVEDNKSDVCCFEGVEHTYGHTPFVNNSTYL